MFTKLLASGCLAHKCSRCLVDFSYCIVVVVFISLYLILIFILCFDLFLCSFVCWYGWNACGQGILITYIVIHMIQMKVMHNLWNTCISLHHLHLMRNLFVQILQSHDAKKLQCWRLLLDWSQIHIHVDQCGFFWTSIINTFNKKN